MVVYSVEGWSKYFVYAEIFIEGVLPIRYHRNASQVVLCPTHHLFLNMRMRISLARAAALTLIVAFMSNITHAVCPFNADQQGIAGGTATSDGLLFIRYALGLTSGAALGANATQGGALPAAIAGYIANPTNNAAIDIDGDGKFSNGDALVIARYLFGFRGDTLAAGVAPVEFAKRYGGRALQAYIDNGCTGLNDLPDPRVQTWNAMNSALVAGNVTNAKTYLTPNGATTVGGAMDALIAGMPAIVATYSELIPKNVSENYAEYLVVRPVPGSASGEKSLHFVIFIRMLDGSWKVDSM